MMSRPAKRCQRAGNTSRERRDARIFKLDTFSHHAARVAATMAFILYRQASLMRVLCLGVA